MPKQESLQTAHAQCLHHKYNHICCSKPSHGSWSILEGMTEQEKWHKTFSFNQPTNQPTNQSQKHTTRPHPEPVKLSPTPHLISLRSTLIQIQSHHLCQAPPPTWPLPLRFPT